jgi:hypothetical protein
MDRHRASLLGLTVSLGLLSACGPELPIEYVIHDRFSDQSATIIQQQAEKWNQVTREWLGQTAFVYRGRFADNEFNPYEDLAADRDGPRRIYRGDHDRWLRQLAEIEGGNPDKPSLLGYNFTPAIVIWPETCLGFKPPNACLASTALHEMGHALGLTHHRSEKAEGIMTTYDTPDKPAAIMADDIRMLCVVHECIKDPP